MANEGTIGYNIAQAKSLQDQISEGFQSVKEKIASPWADVQNTLHSEWIGEDEISYEKEFVKKVNGLYGSAKWVSDVCCATIQSTVLSWVKFQDNNLIEGAEAGSTSNTVVSSNYPTLEEIEGRSYDELEAIQAEAEQLDESSTRGLTNGTSSAGAIQDSVTRYVTNIQSEVNALFDSIRANNAFFGNQVDQINNFISKCGVAIGEVVTAVKDLHDLLEQLAGSRYSEEDTAVSEKADESSNAVTSTVDSIESKWTGAN